MSISIISLREAITIPGRISAITTYNVTEHGRLLRVKENPEGFTFICGTSDGDKFTPNGKTVEVYRHMVKQVTREETAAAAVKPEQKK